MVWAMFQEDHYCQCVKQVGIAKIGAQKVWRKNAGNLGQKSMERKGCCMRELEMRPAGLGPDWVGTGRMSQSGGGDENKGEISSLAE